MKTIVLIISAMVALNNLYAIEDEKIKNSDRNETEVTLAKVSIIGKVIDKVTGEALTGVYIQLEGTLIFTYTDFEGSFSFNNLLPGNYKAVATFISYEKNAINIETSNQKDLKIELESAKMK